VEVSLLTGGQDPHYSHGLALALAEKGVRVDFVGSDDLDSPQLRAASPIRFLNLRGSQARHVSRAAKARRVLLYYARLFRYAIVARPTVFHILWHNKLEAFDRSVLMAYYRLLGRRLVFTAHNVNAGRRDSKDTILNRLSLRSQYALANRIFVHTERMKREIVEEFSIREDKITVIPYGINNAVPSTALTAAEAKAELGIGEREKTILFFGQISPYKGLDFLASAFAQLLAQDASYRLVVAGQPKPGAGQYWADVRTSLARAIDQGRVTLDIRHIPDDKAEVYFKAADILVLPYREIFQSGILFFGYSFGLPVIVSNVGSLAEDVVVGRTGFVCRPEDADDLARTIQRYFESDLYKDLDSRRGWIKAYVGERHSWKTVADMTEAVYAQLLGYETRSAPARRADLVVGKDA
jgi:glycosyltransferase involved in cell wall biosynthesis